MPGRICSLELKKLANLYKRPLQYFLGEGEQAEARELQDPTVRALFRTARELSDEDRQQVLRFAQFLRGAGKAPTPRDDKTKSA